MGNVVVALREIFEAAEGREQPGVALSAVPPPSAGRDAIALGHMLKADFELAVATLASAEAPPAHRRALVRCFGSLLDGLANALRHIAETGCRRECGPRPDLQTADPTSPVLQRIGLSYRIIARSLRSPLRSLDGKRWDDLHAAVEIRNRVAHPQATCDLGISRNNVALITEVARHLIRDFETLAQWQSAQPSRAVTSAPATPGRRPRRKRSGIRYRLCACGSGRKARNCCGHQPTPA